MAGQIGFAAGIMSIVNPNFCLFVVSLTNGLDLVGRAVDSGDTLMWSSPYSIGALVGGNLRRHPVPE